MNSQYIHISEAVKKYDKTRQTFYNYIHKGLIRSKKVNNRTYLHIQDIEELLSQYMHGTQSLNANALEEGMNEIIAQQQQLKHRLQEELETQHESLQSLEESLTPLENNVGIITKKQQDQRHHFSLLLNRFSSTHQKNRFLISMVLIIVVHSIIAGFVFLIPA